MRAAWPRTTKTRKSSVYGWELIRSHSGSPFRTNTAWPVRFCSLGRKNYGDFCKKIEDIRDQSACSKSFKRSITLQSDHHIEIVIGEKGRLYFLYPPPLFLTFEARTPPALGPLKIYAPDLRDPVCCRSPLSYIVLKTDVRHTCFND